MAKAKPKKTPKTVPKKMGRPTKFTKALGQRICAGIASGRSLRKVSQDKGMPNISTVMYWLLDEDKKDFLEQYKAARDIQAEIWADELTDIADDSSNDYMERELRDGHTIDVVNTENIQRSRLRVDTRKWIASKLKPKKYGDRLDLTSKGEKLPTPLLAHAVLNNDSDKKDTSAK